MEKSIIEEIKALSKQFKPDVIRLSQKLIQTPSISGNEKSVSEILLDEMKKLGYDTYFRDDIGNIVGVVNGTSDGPSIMYNSHMDHVAPGNKDTWNGYDPYGGIIDFSQIDDQDKTHKEITQCIHGRGASDMKCGMASQIYTGAILITLRKLGYKFKGRFIFSGVVQEEPCEMFGMTYLVEKTFPQKNLTYDAVVSGEPTSLKLYLGHRGRIEMLATVYGRACHGSAPWLGINSIYKAVPLITKIKDELYPSLSKDPDFNQASISLNIIECLPGALSVVPDMCMLSLDRRTIPGENTEVVLKEVQDIINNLSLKDPDFNADVKVKKAIEKSYTGFECEVVKDMLPWKISKDHGFVKSAAAALKAVGQEVKYGYWDFATDASKAAGIDKKPVIGYSGMQEQYAHSPYDRARLDFIEKSIKGNAAIFLNAVEGNDKTFEKLK